MARTEAELILERSWMEPACYQMEEVFLTIEWSGYRWPGAETLETRLLRWLENEGFRYHSTTMDTNARRVTFKRDVAIPLRDYPSDDADR